MIQKINWCLPWLGLILWCLPLLSSAQTGGNGPVYVLLASENVSCQGANNGQIYLTFLSGVGPLQYQWNNPAAGLSGSGQLSTAMPKDTLSALAPGSYSVTFTDAVGADTVLLASIFEPPLLEGSVQVLSDYNGYQVSCAQAADGMARVMAQGGTPPYGYNWSSGETNPVAEFLTVGIATVTLSDAQGCSLNFSVNLDAPPLLNFELITQPEKCFGENSGTIDLSQISGGLMPYAVLFDGVQVQAPYAWADLNPGSYIIDLRDANGCVLQKAAILPTGLQFEFDAGPDLEMYSGDTLPVLFGSDHPIVAVHANPAEQVIAQGLELSFFPTFNTLYQIAAIDNNGCIAEDVLYIQVHKRRYIYTPNVIYPNAVLSENRFFTLFDGGGVAAIEHLEIFDRNGKRVFEGKMLPSSQPEMGWDGRYSGELVLPDVYFWTARLLYTDGDIRVMVGDVTVLR